MSTVHLYQYKNYYNREAKSLDNISDYNLIARIVAQKYDVQFAYGDGVHASQVVDIDSDLIPDYMVLEEDGNIDSRWYVIECDYTRAHQYRLTLLRDLPADYRYACLHSPAIIDRAMINSTANPLIFRPEGFAYNQIKVGEQLLKDHTGCPWIVGYIPRNTEAKTIQVPKIGTKKPDIVLDSLSDYPYDLYTGKDFDAYPDVVKFNTYAAAGTSGSGSTQALRITYDTDGRPVEADVHTDGEIISHLQEGLDVVRDPAQGFSTRFANWEHNTAPAYVIYNDVLASARGQDLSSYNWTSWLNTKSKTVSADFKSQQGKLIQIRDKYYEVQVELRGWRYNTADVNPLDSLGEKLTKIAGNSSEINTKDWAGHPLSVTGKIDLYRIRYVPADNYACTVEIPAPLDRATPSDAPYDIFCLPYGEIKIKGAQTSEIRTSKDLMLKIAQVMTQSLSGSIYDLQLLPYCPLPDSVMQYSGETGTVDCSKFAGMPDVKSYTLITGASGSYGCLFFADRSSFRRKLYTDFISASLTNPISYKVQHETEFWRITSPNYASSMDVRATSNGGFLTGWYADCTYKPYSPYIHVSPEWGGLYGGNYGDARGLILGGDYSLPMINDQWTNYQINNKNYQVMFDRSVTNLEFGQDLERLSAALGAGVSAASTAATTGVAVGAVTGNPIAGAAAGVSAGAASAVAGIADFEIIKRRQEETRAYKQQMYEFGISNIKARPYNLTKVSAFCANNKIFPILEHFSASQQEIDNLKKYIRYRSMTVGVIGTVDEYRQAKPTWIQARLLRVTGLDDDYHLATALMDEIARGIYI